MKVSLPKDYKKIFTIEEFQMAKEMIKYYKENDEATPAEYIVFAIDAACNGAYPIEILKSEAVIAKNGRIYNWFSDDSGKLDVYINATAYVNNNEVVMIGAYLSDIHSIGPDNGKEVAAYMSLRRFKEVKSNGKS